MIAGLLDKRIDGFGELFRALSFEEIRTGGDAQPGVRRPRRRHDFVISLPGSENAVRLAMTRLILPGARPPRAGGAAVSGRADGTAMRPFRKTIPFEEALGIVREAARPLDRAVPVGLPDAAGRVLAEDIVAGGDVPPFDIRAAMDGYAVVAADTFGAGRQEPARLRCVESIHSGMVSARRLGAGECIQIATGAPLPDGGGCRRHGRGDRAGTGTRYACSRPSTRASTSAGGEPTSRPDGRCSAGATC